MDAINTNDIILVCHQGKRGTQRIPHAKKLFTPNIEKAVTFLDDSQLPSTSNAVERGYRRHRKMQKSIYRVRTQEHLRQRVAMDMQWDEQAQGRLQTLVMLHHQRIGAL